MSDDGLYAGSPYDEFDEYWDDEAALDLADDLAQHATYSPVWQDSCAGELEPYYSDWEYYSDDYYDDDPGILKGDTLDGGAPHVTSNDGPTQQKRGRKRKLDEDLGGQLTANETKALKESIQGTVWAHKQEESVQIFKKGEQETVALLTNWRDVLRKHDENYTYGWSRVYKDESWANDMSLAAMGLHQEHNQNGPPNPSGAEESDLSDGDVDIKGSDGSHLSDDLSDSEANYQPHSTLAITEGDENQPERYIKRRKLQNLPSPPTSTESTSLQLIGGLTKDQEGVKKPVDARTSLAPSIKDLNLDQHGNHSLSQVLEKPTTKAIPKGQKRRLSAARNDLDPDSGKASTEAQSQTSPSSTLSKRQKRTTGQESSPLRRSQRLRKEAG